MAYNTPPRRRGIERLTINLFAGGLAVVGLLYGLRGLEDWSVLNNDRAAAQYYDSQPGTTPEIVAEEHQVLVADEAALEADASIARLTTSAGFVLGLAGNYLLNVLERKRNEPQPDSDDNSSDA